MRDNLSSKCDGYARDYLIVKAIQHGYNPCYKSTDKRAKTVPPQMQKDVQHICLPNPRRIHPSLKVSPKPMQTLPRPSAKSVRKEVITLDNFEIVKRRASLPSIGVLTYALAFVMVLFSIVYIGSRINDEMTHYNDLNDTLLILKEENKTLANALNEKNNLVVIEDIAKNKLGMISIAEATQKYIPLGTENSVTVYDTQNQDVNLGLTLLSAFSEKIGDFLEFLESPTRH